MNAPREEIILAAANGNKFAAQFLTAYAARCHHVDDSFDLDKPICIGDAEAAWLFELAVNPFWNDHKATLLPVMMLATNAWMDSNNMPAGVMRDVVKGYWHEVVWLVAFICGGWQHMREVSKKFRHYDVEPETVPIRKEAPDGALRK